MNVVIIDKDRYIFLDTELPEIRQRLQELSDIIDKVVKQPENTQEEMHEESNGAEKKTTLETMESEVVVAVEDIVSVEVYGNNCTVYTKECSYKLKRCSLEKKLREIGDRFIVRCHKSYGINVRWLTGWKKKDRNLWEPVYRDNVEAPCLISRTYYDEVQGTYKQFNHSDKTAYMQR